MPKHIPSEKDGVAFRSLTIAISTLFLIVACSNHRDGSITVPITAPTQIIPTATPTVTQVAPTVAPLPTSTVVPLPPQTPSKDELDRARLLMLQSFDFFTGPNIVAIQAAGELGLQQSIIPLIELTRFVFEDHSINELGRVLQEFTGESIGGSEWAKWYQWLGDHPELKPLPGYVTGKGDIYSQIDDRFASFFVESDDRRIPMWAIQWGGVARDGIPPLEDPSVIRGDEISYLEPDDPVFGAVVNGEARAYPWRHMASHELANDVIQGKPVTVVF